MGQRLSGLRRIRRRPASRQPMHPSVLQAMGRAASCAVLGWRCRFTTRCPAFPSSAGTHRWSRTWHCSIRAVTPARRSGWRPRCRSGWGAPLIPGRRDGGLSRVPSRVNRPGWTCLWRVPPCVASWGRHLPGIRPFRHCCRKCARWAADMSCCSMCCMFCTSIWMASCADVVCPGRSSPASSGCGSAACWDWQPMPAWLPGACRCVTSPHRTCNACSGWGRYSGYAICSSWLPGYRRIDLPGAGPSVVPRPAR